MSGVCETGVCWVSLRVFELHENTIFFFFWGGGGVELHPDVLVVLRGFPEKKSCSVSMVVFCSPKRW